MASPRLMAVSLSCKKAARWLGDAGVSKSCYFPVIHIFTYNLRVTGQDVKGNFDLGNITFSDEV